MFGDVIFRACRHLQDIIVCHVFYLPMLLMRSMCLFVFGLGILLREAGLVKRRQVDVPIAILYSKVSLSLCSRNRQLTCATRMLIMLDLQRSEDGVKRCCAVMTALRKYLLLGLAPGALSQRIFTVT